MNPHRRLLRLQVAALLRAELPRLARVADAVERYADGAITYAELRVHRDKAAWLGPFGSNARVQYYILEILLRAHGREIVSTVTVKNLFRALCQLRDKPRDYADDAILRVQRCVSTQRRTIATTSETTRRVATAIYTDADWSSMPILRDALLDADCDDASVLSHCLEPTHWRGCWVVEALRGAKR